MLLLTAGGILYEGGYRRLIVPVVPPEITPPVTVVVMVGTLAINLAVSTYERRKGGEEYQSQILVADSQHTKSDVFVSIAVLGGGSSPSDSGFRRPIRSSHSPSASSLQGWGGSGSSTKPRRSSPMR